jgi:hypothetical protein
MRELDAEQDEHPHEEHRDQREHEERKRTGDQVHPRQHRNVFAEHLPKQLEEQRHDRARQARGAPPHVGVRKIAIEQRKDRELGGEREERLGDRGNEHALEK